MKSQKTNIINSPRRASEKRKVYLVRDDSFFCTGKKQTEFVKEFCSILQNYTDSEVVCFDAEKQIKSVKRHIKKKYPGRLVLSLDKWYEGDFNYKLSRIFNANQDQSIPVRFYSKMDDELNQWLEDIHHWEFVLVDDDIASGATKDYMFQKFRKAGIGFPAFVSMESVYNKKYIGRVFDIVDIRDFIPNSKNGGLLCFTDNGLRRIPYLYPQVDLVSRMKLTKDAAILFTRDLKELLEKHFNYTHDR